MRHTICYRDWSSDVCSSDLVVTRLASDRGAGFADADKNGCYLLNRTLLRSEEGRVGKEGRYRWSPYHLKKKKINKHINIINSHIFHVITYIKTLTTST